MKPSDWTAGVALIVSISSLAISLRNLLRDRYRLRCSGFLQWVAGKKEDFTQIGVVVTNEGRRPVSVTAIYYETDPAIGLPAIRSAIYGGLPNDLRPVELAENQTRQFMSRKLTRSDMMRLGESIDICVEDSRGKIHHIHIQNEARDEQEVVEQGASRNSRRTEQLSGL